MRGIYGMMRRGLTVAMALALWVSLTVPALAAEASGAASGEAAGSAAEQAAQAAAEAAMTYGGASGVSWALWQEGEITASGAEAKVPEFIRDPAQSEAQEGELYGIGSVSKMYTTAAVMKLAEAGKVSLDAPVTTYLPEFRMADGRYKDITVRMLLNHSSGLMGSSMGSAMLYDDPSTAAADLLLERLAGQRLKADPGAYSVYCNDGFTLAELVVEAVSGQDYIDYVRDALLTPLGLAGTFAPSDGIEGAAPIYQAGYDRILPMDCLGVVGTGGLYATAADLAAFGGALTGTELLSQGSLEAMAAPEYKKGIWPDEGPDGLAFGLGWDSVDWYPFCQSGITALVKGGDTQYYHAGLVVLPEHHMAAAVLSSGGVSTYNEMAASQMLIAALREKGVEVDETPVGLPEAKPAAMPRELLEYGGYYGSLVPYQVKVGEDGTLEMCYLSQPNVPAQKFSYYSDGSFRDADNTAALRFVEEDNGKVYLLQQAFTALPGLGGLPTRNYAAVRLEADAEAPALQEAWEKQMAETDIVPMNERYSSQVYLALSVAGTAMASEEESAGSNIPGYIGALRIVDENRAEYAVQLPGNAGRDGYDLEFREDENGTVWLYQSNGSVFMSTEGVKDIYTGSGASHCTIQPDGYARWYKIGGNAAGKTVTVSMPEDAGFWVYDGKYQVTGSSVLGDGNSVTLPAEGLIVFAGDPGARFDLSFR